MAIISKPLFVYLQRPDNGVWVTVGRYQADPATRLGKFKYAPSYVDADAARYLDGLLLRIQSAYDEVAYIVAPQWRTMLHLRMRENIALLSAAA